jgi:hypothetical protein
MSRILSDLFRDRCRASRSFRISILMPVASFSSAWIVFFNVAAAELLAEIVVDGEDDEAGVAGVAGFAGEAGEVLEAVVVGFAVEEVPVLLDVFVLPEVVLEAVVDAVDPEDVDELEEGELLEEVVPVFVVVLVPVPLAVFVLPEVVLEAVVDGVELEDVLVFDPEVEAEARSAL